MDNIQPLLSIVICTFNRCELLKSAIKSCIDQTAEKSLFEIIVIDNNSTDQTQLICQNYESFGVKYFLEKEQGLSSARNAGYKVASGDYIGYLDDDAIAEINWASKAIKIIKDQYPDAFGGPIFPLYLNQKPEWFKDEYEIRMHQDFTGWLAKSNYLSGSNMFFRKSILEEFGGFNKTLGMKGSDLAYGEETELIIKMHKADKKVFYDQELTVNHLVPEFKQNLSYFIYKQIEQAQLAAKLSPTSSFYDPLSEIIEYIKTIDSISLNFKQAYINHDKIENSVIEKILTYISKLIIHNEKVKNNYLGKRRFKDKILDMNLRKLLHAIKK